MRKFGFSKKKAKFIEKSHKTLFKEYYQYISDRLDEAQVTGFVRLAYGLKLRTPVIKAGIKGGASKQAIEQERRSAGNALFQSYGLMTMRAFSKFMEMVRNHKEYYYQVRPIITIYDSIYLDIPNDIDCLHWCNENLIKCMRDITGCPELSHPIISLESDLEVFYPSWSDPISLSNGLSKQEILDKLA